jgi:hypothetical protein
VNLKAIKTILRTNNKNSKNQGTMLNNDKSNRLLNNYRISSSKNHIKNKTKKGNKSIYKN